MRISRFKDLQEKRVCGSRASLFRLRRDDPTFPAPVQIGGGVGWIEDEIDAWLAARPRIAKRDQVSMIERNKLAVAETLADHAGASAK
jgi:predicted DNA-binding transcriptional regulator AlpA